MKTPNVQPVRSALHSDAGGAQLQKYSKAAIEDRNTERANW
jgi:hypothetical protein